MDQPANNPAQSPSANSVQNPVPTHDSVSAPSVPAVATDHSAAQIDTSASDQQKVPEALPASADTAAQSVATSGVSMPAPVAAADQPVDATQPAEVKEVETVSLQSDIPVPPNAISGPLKEFGPPIAAPSAEVALSTESEPDIPQEVKEAGVEATPNTEQPKVPQAVQQATGIKPVNDAVPVPTAPSDTIQLPMPETEALQTMKTSKVADSIRWLATLVIQQAKRAHGQLTGK